MKKWIQKAAVQKTISYLPFGRSINYLFQKYVTKGVHLTDSYFYDRLEHAKQHLNAYKKYTGNLVPQTALEIGTGWYPIVPVAFFLTGARHIYSVDIYLLTSKERLETTLRKFETCCNNGQLQQYITVLPERYNTLTQLLQNSPRFTLTEMLQQLGITCLIEDARKLSLPDESVDLVNSNNTFEHIYPHILTPVLQEFKRVVKKEGGVMSHFIDMSDHFAHFDKSITIYNFLRFSDAQWKWIDNNIQPQNRCRVYDYRLMFAQVNLPITEQTCWPGNPAQLQNVHLHPKFAQHPLTEVAISHCHFISDMRCAAD